MKLLALFAFLTALSAVPVLAQGSPCALVTQSEASTALGVPAMPGVAKSLGGSIVCRYFSRDKKKQVSVATITAGDYAMVQKAGTPALDGIGTDALYFGGSIYIQKGAAFARVGLLRSMADMAIAPPPALVVLAKAIASRL